MLLRIHTRKCFVECFSQAPKSLISFDATTIDPTIWVQIPERNGSQNTFTFDLIRQFNLCFVLPPNYSPSFRIFFSSAVLWCSFMGGKVFCFVPCFGFLKVQNIRKKTSSIFYFCRYSISTFFVSNELISCFEASVLDFFLPKIPMFE